MRTLYSKVRGKVRSLKDDASDKSREDWAQRKAREIEKFIGLDNIDEESKELVFKKLAANQDFILTKAEKLTFTPEETLVLRDFVRMGTNGVYRLKQIIEVLRPELKGLLFLPDIRKVLQELEGKGVIPVITKRVELQISKDENKKNMCTYYFVSNPGQLLEAQSPNKEAQEE